ncbi:MAG: CRTAC1 family protein, partial [Acidobacteria bacterium]|nr:CRTAC1 family protein [Acidobacteriota bacterium]
MSITRRGFLTVSALASWSSLFGQGVAPRSVKPQAKPAPSGRAFNAHFTDVSAAAGLTAPVIYGNSETKDYIVEATGCGCAFIDYDNDGWLD